MEGVAGGWGRHNCPEEIAAGDRVTVDAEIDGRIVNFRAVVLRVHPDALWVAVAGPDPRIGRLEPGQPLHLTFSRDAGTVVTSSAFLHAVAAEPERLLAVERPLGGQSAQRHQFLRLDVERTVRIGAINDVAIVGRTAEATTVNVSARGLLLETDMSLSVGDKIAFVLVLEPRDIVALQGQVVAIEDPKPQAAAPRTPTASTAAPRTAAPAYLVAVRFLEPSLSDQDRIAAHLFAVERGRREAERMAG